jgi:hopanoid-associated phosphorylase
MIGIIVALAEELSTLTSKKIVKGEYGYISENIIVIYSGAGRDNAAKSAKILIEKGATALISWGCAGALALELRPGDLLFPEKVVTASGQTLKITENWLTHIKKNLPIIHRSVVLVESLTPIVTSEGKKRLHQQTQAIAVDMESAAIIEIAEEFAVKSLVIRTIVDPVNLNLPPAINHALNTEGEIVLSKLLTHLLICPQQLPSLIKLGLNFSTAKNKLKAVAKHLDTIVGFDLNTIA